jgi:hypothetical protein
MLIIGVRNMARTDNINSPSLVYDQRKLVEESKELSKKSLKAYIWSPCDDADEGCLCVIAESSKEAKKIGYHYWCSEFMGFDGEYRDIRVKRNKEGKDVFEYSVFGSPQQKIGNFTQTKIGGFS